LGKKVQRQEDQPGTALAVSKGVKEGAFQEQGEEEAAGDE